MKALNWFIPGVLIIVASNVCYCYNHTLPDGLAASIDTVAARKHITFLASDEMRGRNTLSAELDRAADYISDRLDAFGVERVQGKRFHTYTLEQHDLELPAKLVLHKNGNAFEAEVRNDFVPFENTGEGAISGARVVFAGYGISAPDYNYDDYANIDVKGAVVLILRGEPRNSDSTRFMGAKHTKYSWNREKMRMAKEHGAIGMLVVDVPRMGRTPMAVGYPWPSLFPALGSASLPLTLSASADNLMNVHVNDKVVSFIVDSLERLRVVAQNIDTTLTPNSFVTNVTVDAVVNLVHKRVEQRNVVGMIRGATHPDEYVVVGAHYDHVGIQKQKDKTDTICNGADDNASGTTGLLLLAEALSKSATKPDRSILFIAFSAEERGLLGSKAYVADPLLDLGKCVAMVNMDMIGRMDSNTLYIGGDTRCPDLAAINAEENSKMAKPISIKYEIDHFFERSDQASFAEKKIPVIFFFTGEHKDYHKVTDEVSLINMPGLVNIARLALATTWRAAEQSRTTFIEKKSF